MRMSKELLAHLFYCYPEEGILVRKIPIGKGKVGDTAGHIRNDGYAVVGIHGRQYYVHRLIWLWVYGVYTKKFIDHIDGDRGNNRISNLRAVSAKTNSRNTRTPSNSTTCIAGVYWHKPTCKWRAHIKVDYVQRHLGRFEDFFEACCARKSAENTYGFHPNHGRKVYG